MYISFEVRVSILSIEWRSMDTKFSIAQLSIAHFRCLLREQCLPWLRRVTGLQLTDTIDITCSKYDYTGIQKINVRA